MKILRANDHKHMPWKNGLGQTVEIAVFPPAATVDTFDWRISMATVSEDGPFSVFPGIDRTLSILEGTGMELFVEGREQVLLTQASPPHPFAADAATTARLVDGAITDLNVMTRRGRFSHAVERLVAPTKLVPGAGTTLVLCHRGRMEARRGETTETLSALDCLLLNAEEALEISGTGEGFLIRLR
ncbi:HutD/Ves family protein [Neorhizobium sp. NPDC001467]|uniref:HutD/Ves family protein n=1 Tax=Neorhizobium sp. NPDC001467 TaxID=3390595 RepID=UPI003CFE7D34